MIREVEYIAHEDSDTYATKLLIDMTNEYIDYRNQVFDSSCNMVSFNIEGAEDYKYVYDMDIKLQKVRDYLDTI